jgi:hypothetical protein
VKPFANTIAAGLLALLIAPAASSAAQPDGTIAFPAHSSVALSAWDAGCDTSVGDLCGTAKDNNGKGLGKVQVSVRRMSDGRYWTGSTFAASSSVTYLTPTGMSKWSLRLAASSLAPGEHRISLKVTDKKGDVVTVGFTFTLTPATPPPAPRIDVRPANPTNVTSAAFEFSDTQDGVSLLCHLDGGAWGSCSTGKATYAGPLAERSHTFGVKARDAAGRESAETTYAWGVDVTKPPVPAIWSGPAALTRSTSATFVFTVAETGAKLLCRRDTAVFDVCTSPTSYSHLSEDAHTFSVRSRDAAGNESASAVHRWTIELAPRGRILAVRDAVAAKRSGLRTTHARYWLDRTLDSLDWAADSDLWTGALVKPTPAGEKGVRALVSAIRRMYWSDPAVRQVTAAERLDIAQVLHTIVLDRMAENPLGVSDTFRKWLGKGDESLRTVDLYKAGSYYTRAWVALR